MQLSRFARLAALFRSSFLSRALLATLSGIIVSILLVTVAFVLISRTELQRQRGLRAEAITEFAASQSAFPMLVNDQAALDRVARTTLANEDVLFVIFSDTSGRALAAASRNGVQLQEVRVGPVCSVATGEGKISVFEVCRNVDGYDWEPEQSSSGPIGSVRIGFSMARQSAMFERVVYSGAGIALVMLVLFTIAYALLLRRLVRPLKELSESAREVGEGDLSRRTRAEGEDEVAQVARAFNRMVEKLQSTMVSKSYVDDIIRSMGDSLIVVDAAKNIRTVNEATCVLLGYHAGELIGPPAGAIVEGEGRERSYRTKGGARIPVLFSHAALREDRGEVWLAQDITGSKRVQDELRAAKEAAEDASRAKTLFLATMSHELKTPLNAIIGYGELLEDVARERGQTGMREDLRKILSAGRHLLGMLNEVLDTARLEAGRMELHTTAFRVMDVVADIVNTVKPLAEKNGSRIEVLAGDDEGVLFADEMKFRQSLLNLMTNACKFTSHGKISVAISRQMVNETESMKIDVRDTGIGIAPEHLPRLFLAFSQVDPSHARKYGGSGLGLSISRNLCEMMGGTISVESEPGKGSVFTMTVPGRIRSLYAEFDASSRRECPQMGRLPAAGRR